jgi:hypothetical protein
MIRTKHPILVGGLIEYALAFGIVAFGLVAGWSDGELGLGFTVGIGIGTVVLVKIMHANWEYAAPPWDPARRRD